MNNDSFEAAWDNVAEDVSNYATALRSLHNLSISIDPVMESLSTYLSKQLGTRGSIAELVDLELPNLRSQIKRAVRTKFKMPPEPPPMSPLLKRAISVCNDLFAVDPVCCAELLKGVPLTTSGLSFEQLYAFVDDEDPVRPTVSFLGILNAILDEEHTGERVASLWHEGECIGFCPYTSPNHR